MYTRYMKLYIKKVDQNAKLPSYAHASDAGMDMYALERVEMAPLERVQIKTGIAFELEIDHVALVWDKSGLSHKKGIKVLGGVLDAGYRGEILIGAVNLGNEKVIFEAGDKVAQVLIQKIEYAEIEEVQELNTADRGEQGFGSTGAK